ncbi:MAG: sigma-70 family RNA polymerase sigma factor [Oscillospiraceae bacterium]|nr:sigma-70 family RNA polymerase sigma factor [Oscillospiraceae bacterium]
MRNYHKNQNQEQERIIRTYADAVYRLAYSYSRNKADADDIFQEVFFRYLKKQPEFESLEHAKAWFLRVTANCAKSFLTSAWRRHTQPLEQDILFEQPEENQLDGALRQLPVKYREVIHLYYYEGYQTDEIAKILKRKPSTVRTQLTRARESLAKILKEEN